MIKTEKSKDLISRADAIEAVHKYFVKEIDKTPHEIDEDGDDVYTDMPTVNSLLICNKELSKALKALPSAEAVQGEWIPCSEGLPDERQDVYVTALWDDYGDYVTAYGMRTKFGWNLHSNAEGELIKGYTVVAWMSLPEPYEGSESDETD